MLVNYPVNTLPAKVACSAYSQVSTVKHIGLPFHKNRSDLCTVLTPPRLIQPSVAAGDAYTPVDDDGEEPAEARNPTFPQLQVLIFQQLKNAIPVEALEAVAGQVLGKYMGFRSD